MHCIEIQFFAFFSIHSRFSEFHWHQILIDKQFINLHFVLHLSSMNLMNDMYIFISCGCCCCYSSRSRTLFNHFSSIYLFSVCSVSVIAGHYDNSFLVIPFMWHIHFGFDLFCFVSVYHSFIQIM